LSQIRARRNSPLVSTESIRHNQNPPVLPNDGGEQLLLRFGLTPLYLRFEDVWRAAQILREIIATAAWDRPEFRARAKVV